jgi:hypothetical protein
MKNRALPLFFSVCLLALFLTAWAGAGPGVLPGFAPKLSVQNAYQLQPKAGPYIGAPAWVLYQGEWDYLPVCPTTCDGYATCVTAGGLDGGLGCYVRSEEGYPGACSQTSWSVSPNYPEKPRNFGDDFTDGYGPLATLQELWRRQRGCVVNDPVNAVVISVNHDVQTGDFFSAPSIGPKGYVVLDCQPGAKTLASGSVTSFTAQSGNAPAQITASGTNFLNACNGGSCVGYRIRDTNGARAGLITWIVHIPSSHVAWVSDPELDPWIVDPTTRPAPGATGLVSQAPSVGDAFVIERLALINTPSFPGWISGDESNYDNARLIIHSCASSITIQYPTYGQVVLSDVSVPSYGNPWVVSFIGGYPGWVTGTFAAYATLHDDYGVAPFTAQSEYFYGAAILGDARLNGATFYQGSVIAEMCQVCPFAGGNSSVEFGSTSVNTSALGIVYADAGAPLLIQAGANLSMNAANGLWGPGAAGGICAHIQRGSSFTTQATDSCGDAGATNVAGTVVQFSDAGTISGGATFGPVN